MDPELTLPAVPWSRRSLEREKDFDAAQARADGRLSDAPLPASVDLRAAWHGVGDQGRTASCVGWAVADSVLRWQLVKAGRLAPDERLSVRHVWMSAKEFDQREEYPSTFLEEDGTSLKTGLDIVRKFGAVTEAELPWGGGLAAGTPEAFYASAAEHRIAAYYNLGDDETDDRSVHFDDWRRWLAEQGPVLVLIKINPSTITTPADPVAGLDESAVVGSHAAALFGYGPDHFLLRSSWGTGWGQQGYVRMDLDYTAAAVIESYGVVV